MLKIDMKKRVSREIFGKQMQTMATRLKSSAILFKSHILLMKGGVLLVILVEFVMMRLSLSIEPQESATMYMFQSISNMHNKGQMHGQIDEERQKWICKTHGENAIHGLQEQLQKLCTTGYPKITHSIFYKFLMR